MPNTSIFDKTIKISKNQPIYIAGDTSSSFYYILSGTVELYEQIGKTKVFFKTFPIFSTFGVDEFITHEKRRYTAIASEGSEFLEITNNNFEEFSSNLPKVVLNILNNLSTDIKNLNHLLLLKENESCNSACQGTVTFVDDDKDNIYIISDRVYPILLPDIHKKYLYDVSRTCPVCDHTFKTNSVRLSHMIFKSEEENLRIRYNDIDPIWYQLLTCPKCNYINFRQTFRELKYYLVEPIKNILSKTQYFEPSSIKISINDVFDEYYHFLRVIKEYRYSDLVKSRIWESLMWLYDDVNDKESYVKAKENYIKALKSGWYNDSDSLSPENESLITYKVALLELELGNFKEAHIFCMRALQVKGISSSHKRKVQNKLYEISELNRKKTE